MKCVGVTRERSSTWRTTSDNPGYIFSLAILRPKFLFIYLEPLSGLLDPTLSFYRGNGFYGNESLRLTCLGPTGYIVDLRESTDVSALQFAPCSMSALFRFWTKRIYLTKTLELLLEHLVTGAVADNRAIPKFQQIDRHDATTARISPRFAIARKTKDHFAHVVALAKQQSESRSVATLESPQPIPLVSLVAPLYNTPPQYLTDLIKSFDDQGPVGAELVLSDDGSTSPKTLTFLNTLRCDSRIKIVRHSANTGIAAATNRGIASSKGRWVAMIDHDDALSPGALNQVSDSIRRFPNAKFFYTDEVITNSKLSPVGYILKPAFDPVLLTGVNYVNHLSIYRRDMLETIGRVREGFEGSQDYDLVLRYLSKVAPNEIVHIPYPAYKWRRSSASFSTKFLDKSLQSARRALADHFAPSMGAIPIAPALHPSLHRPRLDAGITNWPSVSVVIPSRDGFPLISRVLADLRSKTDYPDLEIIVVDNGTKDHRVLDLYRNFSRLFSKFSAVINEEQFNFSRQINRGIRLAKGRHVLILNNDIEVQSSDWLKEMVSCLAYPGVGIVGAKLLYPNRTLQHAGVIVGFGDYAGHWFERKPENFPGPFARLAVRQSLSAVTGACMLISRNCLEAVGLLDERFFAIAYNDVDYCLRALEQGFRIVWTPFASLIHHGSASRGSDDTLENRERFSREKAFLKHKYGTSNFNDPASSPWYTRNHSDPGLLMLDEIPLSRAPSSGWQTGAACSSSRPPS